MSESKKHTEGLSPLKQAFLALEEAEAKLEALERARSEPIAVIGIGCRFPGKATTPQAFWRNLCEGHDAITEVPSDRWDLERFYDSDPETPGKMSTRWGGFIDDVDRFDATLFGITPREARSMDPQQRILMEVAWEALEDAGHASLISLEGSSTGVFLGISTDDYALLQMNAMGLEGIDTYFVSGVARSIASGRLSYQFGLQGPAVSIDTACSSSLLAVHQACRSLLDGECRMALAAGVNVILSPANTVALTKFQMMAPDGRCKVFDAAADGFVRGEGCGVVVLKLLKDALADNDHIYASILGSAANQDGPSSGLTAPHGPSQEAVIRAALKCAGIKPAQVGYVETHGTGTSLGDPIEVRALGACFSEGRSPDHPLVIGAVKANIGHLEAASGIAGLIKTVLILHHRRIPPSLHFHVPNPGIPWEDYPLHVPTRCMALQSDGERALCGVTALGFSGTNVHAVLSTAPENQQVAAGMERRSHIVAVSAPNAEVLDQQVRRLDQWLDSEHQESLPDVAYTLGTGRTHHFHRAVVVCENLRELKHEIEAYQRGGESGLKTGVTAQDGELPRVAFLFTGQGSQFPGMGSGLDQTYPAFRAAIDQCDELLQPMLERSIRKVLFPPEGGGGLAIIHQTLYTQPALFVLEYALARLWMSWGIRPASVFGHSIGEYVAACIAGITTLEDALHMVVIRSRMMQSIRVPGAMYAVMAPESEVERYVAPYADSVSIAAVNGPNHVVISGSVDKIEQISGALQKAEISVLKLNVSHAFHSPLLDPLLDQFERDISHIRLQRPKLHIVSNVTGRAAMADEISTPAYWRRHARSPVRFLDCMRALAEKGTRIFIEVGPQPVVLGMARRFLTDSEFRWLPSLNQGEDDGRCILSSLGDAYLAGLPVNWESVGEPCKRRRISLPTYPFQRRRYWIAQTKAASARSASCPDPSLTAIGHPLLGARMDSATGRVFFRSSLRNGETAFFKEHRVAGSASLPMAAVVEAASAAAKLLGDGQRPSLVEMVSMDRAIGLSDDAPIELEWAIDRDPDGGYSFQLFSRSNSETVSGIWQKHAAGILLPSGDAKAVPVDPSLPQSVDSIRRRCSKIIESEEFYRRLAFAGLDFGPAFHTVETVCVGKGEALGKLRSEESYKLRDKGFDFSPLLLDGALQITAAVIMGDNPEDYPLRLYLPVGVDHVQLEPFEGGPLWGHAALRLPFDPASRSTTCDVRLIEENGRQIAQLRGCRFLSVQPVAPRLCQTDSAQRLLYQVMWKTLPERSDTLKPAVGGGFEASLQQMADRVEAEIPEVAAVNGLDRYDRSIAALDELVCLYIIRALQELGWTLAPGQHVQTQGLCAKLGVRDGYRRLLDRFLRILSEEGFLAQVGSGWTVARSLEAADPSTPNRASMVCREAAAIELDLVCRCGARLAEVLRGDANPVDILFTGEAYASVAALYTESATARVYNALAGKCVADVLRAWPRGRPLNVLEIGAGTGGTTQSMLEALGGRDFSYLFTDISPAFVRSAAERFKHRTGFTAQPLDIEKDPEAQGMAARRFDLVIAANVLHATADLTDTLRRVNGLTAPGGLLVLVEVTAPQRWIDITFGLTEGWWKFSDHALRKEYPFLSVEQWKLLLLRTGFQNVVAVPDPKHELPSRSLELGSVMVARKGPDSYPISVNGHSVESSTQRWFILSDDGGIGSRLQEQLMEKGISTASVAQNKPFTIGKQQYPSRTFKQNGDFDFLFDNLNKESGLSPSKVLFLWGLDRTGKTADGAEEPLVVQEDLASPVLALCQSLLAASSKQPPQLIFVTRAAQAVTGCETVDPAGAALWGMVRGVMLEHPEFRCKLIDIEPGTSTQQAAQVLAECETADREDQLAIRGETIYALRLEPVPDTGPTDGQRLPQRLDISERGLLENLFWRDINELSPGPGQVRIAVQATGLNFRDVLNALGVYAGGAVPLGGECAGVVTGIGDNVGQLQYGDRVLAMASNAFGSEVIADAALTFPIPEGMEFERAAALPIAYTTAAYALEELAGIRKGQSILIHAAAGGVGLAAVHLARLAGAEIFATAGNPEKREYLKQLGIAHVLHSRTLDFAGYIMAETRGKGVSIVLNSLAGDHIERSMELVAAGGVFLELGRSGIKTAEEAKRIRPDIVYHPIDLTEDMTLGPEKIRPVVERVLGRVKSGALPPLPCKVFPRDAVVEAFRYMSRARQIGKIVVRWPHRSDLGNDGPVVRADGTYWVTGGMGALGLFTAEWLAKKGAGHLVLTGRNQPGPDARKKIEEIRSAGTPITVMTSDVSSRREVDSVLEFIRKGYLPLRGIIHAAGALDDGIVDRLSRSRFQTVLRPKVAGSWHLHQATKDMSLDFFVLYSSVAGLLGSAGQTNHCAACAYMDALAHMRRAMGLRALSIDWGAWAKAGAAVKEAATARAAVTGVDRFSPETGLRLLETLIHSNMAHAAALSVDWRQYISHMHPDGHVPPLLEHVIPAHRHRTDTHLLPKTAKNGLLQRLQAAPAAQRKRILASFVHEETLRTLGLDESDVVDPDKPLSEMGLDSLMLVELRNALGRALEHVLPATLLFDYPTINTVTDYLERELHLKTAKPFVPFDRKDTPPASTDDLLSRIEAMQDDDIDRLISGRDLER